MGKPRVNLEDFSDMLHFDTEQEKAVRESPAALSAQGESPEPAGILEGYKNLTEEEKAELLEALEE